MSLTVSQLIASVQVSGVGQATTELAGMSGAAENAGGKLKNLAIGGALIAGAAIVGIGAKSLQMAGQFQEGMTTLVTGAGEAKGNLQLVTNGILAMAPAVGTSTAQLTSGMYMIESAGYHGAAGLAVLQAAAQGAKVGNADLGTVANATTTIMTDFGIKSNHAATAVNALIATVANGKTTMSDLSASLSQILPTASAAKIGLNDTMGAMATMTGEGVPAANAATYLRQTILGLVAPSKGTVTALKEVGLSSTAVADEMKVSLPGALKMITDAVGKKFPEGSAAYVNALKNISGGSKNMQGMLDLTGDHLKTFESNVKNIAGAVKAGGNSITGWSLVQKDWNFKLAQAGEVVETLMIKIGTALIPVVEQLLAKIMPVVVQFGNWLTSGNRLQNGINAVIGVLSTIIGIISAVVSVGANIVGFFQHCQVAALALLIPLGALGGLFTFLAVDALLQFLATLPAIIAGFITEAGAATLAAIATLAAAMPFILVGLAIGALIAIIVLLVQHWGQVVSFLQGTWQAFSSWFLSALSAVGTFFHNAWDSIVNFLKAAWQAIVNAAKIGFQLLLLVIFGPIIAIVDLFKWLYAHNTYFQELVDKIRSIVQAGITWLQNIWTNIITFIVEQWTLLKIKAEIYFLYIYVAIEQKILQIEAFIKSVWNRILGFLEGIWTAITASVSAAWGKISGIFASAWSTYVATPLQNLWNSITGYVGGWAGQAVQWGENLIKGFISGILNMVGGVGNAVGQIASKVAGFLGFHSPAKEGPGQELEEWPKNMVATYAKGLIAALPTMQAALNTLMLPVGKTLSGQSGNSAGTGSFAGARGAGYQFPAMQSGQPIVINMPPYPDIQLDGQRLTRGLMPHLSNQIRYGTGVIR